MLAVELILAGLFMGDENIIYREFLLGFSVASAIGLIIGMLYKRKVSKKIHSQIAEILKLKAFKSEDIIK